MDDKKPCEKCGEPGLIDGCCYDHAKLCSKCRTEPAHFNSGVCTACLEFENSAEKQKIDAFLGIEA